MDNFNFEVAVVEAAKLPYVNIDRESFLRKELSSKYDKEIVDLAIEYNPAYAGIVVEDIDKIADGCITSELIRVTSMSTLAGIPGGIAMVGTIPVDMAQYCGHVLRLLQELIYLYGWKELELKESNVNDETKNLLILFTGIMFGVGAATNTISKIAEKAAIQVAK